MRTLIFPPVSLWFGVGGHLPLTIYKETQPMTYCYFAHQGNNNLVAVLFTNSPDRPKLPDIRRACYMICFTSTQEVSREWKLNTWHKMEIKR